MEKYAQVATGEVERLMHSINAAIGQSNKMSEHLKELSAQQMENTLLKEDLSGLEEDAQLYRLTGMVLKKETKEECNETVDRRLKYLAKEIESKTASIKEANAKVQTYFEQLNKLKERGNNV